VPRDVPDKGERQAQRIHLGFSRVEGFESRVYGSGLRVYSLGFRVWG